MQAIELLSIRMTSEALTATRRRARQATQSMMSHRGRSSNRSRNGHDDGGGDASRDSDDYADDVYILKNALPLDRELTRRKFALCLNLLRSPVFDR